MAVPASLPPMLHLLRDGGRRPYSCRSCRRRAEQSKTHERVVDHNKPHESRCVYYKACCYSIAQQGEACGASIWQPTPVCATIPALVLA
jgi:hypothetical protein